MVDSIITDAEETEGLVEQGPLRRRTRRDRLVDSGLGDVGFVVVSNGLAAVVLYLFLAVAARALAPADYGLFASLFGLIVFFGIVATAIQTNVTRRVAAADSGARPREIALSAVQGVALTVSVLLVFALGSRSVAGLLHADGVGPVLATGLVAATLIPWATLLGIYQGLGRFKAFGILMLLQALARLGSAVVLLWSGDVTALLIGVALSVLLPLVAGWFWLGRNRPAWPEIRRRIRWRVLTGAVASRDQLAFGWVLVAVVAIAFPSVGDVVVVRHLYAAHAAGLYAGTALIGRCILFLPAGINPVLFSRYLSAPDDGSRRRTFWMGLGATAVVCLAAVMVLAALPSLTLDVLVGPGYREAVGLLRPYLLGSLAFGLASTFAYFQLARGRRRYILGVLLPHLVVLAVLPRLLPLDLHLLSYGLAAVGCSLLLTSVVAFVVGERSR